MNIEEEEDDAAIERNLAAQYLASCVYLTLRFSIFVELQVLIFRYCILNVTMCIVNRGFIAMRARSECPVCNWFYISWC